MAANSPPFPATTGLTTFMVLGDYGHSGLPVRVSGEGGAQGNSNASANGVQAESEKAGARCWGLETRRRGLGGRRPMRAAFLRFHLLPGLVLNLGPHPFQDAGKARPWKRTKRGYLLGASVESIPAAMGFLSGL